MSGGHRSHSCACWIWIFYTPDVINSYLQLAFQNPFGAVSNLVVRPADPQNPLPVFTVDDPLAQATRLITNNRNGMQRNLRDGQVQQWNLTLQYLITKDTLFEAAYHGLEKLALDEPSITTTNPFRPSLPISHASFRIQRWVTSYLRVAREGELPCAAGAA